ncbi:MAG TPA: hypothetical protein DHW42_01230 [Candidatus Marinimicrobia bacterium]|nr:hypothetical protein [Candidatus Neomarinimicrobiota bacterium]
MKFVFFGKPFAKQSTRFTCSGFAYTPAKIKTAENNIRAQAIQQLPKGFVLFQGEIFITKCHFIFVPPKSMRKRDLKKIKDGEIVYKKTRPDLTDNLFKGLIDSLSGIVFSDDSRIVAMDNVKKYYGFVPRIELEIQE